MRRLADETGLAGTVLIIVIAWALVAVLMLTRTLVAAQSIEGRVDVIFTEVASPETGLVNETALVAVLQDTEQIAASIDTAAAPLSSQVGQVVEAATSIDSSAAQILNVAGSINSTAKSIGSTVNSINSNLSAILGEVRGTIHCGFDIENPTLQAVIDRCGEGSVTLGTNLRVDVLLDLIRGIKSDTGNILAEVLEIHGHANSIDCNPATLLAATGDACGAHDDEFGG